MKTTKLQSIGLTKRRLRNAHMSGYFGLAVHYQFSAAKGDRIPKAGLKMGSSCSLLGATDYFCPHFTNKVALCRMEISSPLPSFQELPQKWSKQCASPQFPQVPATWAETSKMPKVVRRGCKGCFDQLERWSPKSLLHQCNLVLHQCNPLLHQCSMILVHIHQNTFCTLS